MPFLSFISGGLLQARVQQAYGTRNAAIAGRSKNEDWSGAAIASPDLPAPSRSAMPACAAPGCSSGWLKSRKGRGRPCFDGDWACSERCLQHLVRSALRRETGEASVDEAYQPHRHRIPLGLVLLAQGWITHRQLQTALHAQRSTGRGRIGDWLMEGCGLSAEQVTRGVSLQWNCPVLTLEGFSPSAMALVIPPALAQQANLVPVRAAGKSVLYVAFNNRMNAAAALALETMSGLRVECGLLTEKDSAAASAAIRQADPVPSQTLVVPHVDALVDRIARTIAARKPIASRLVRIQDTYWLRLWLESGSRSGIGDLPATPHDLEDHLYTVDLSVSPRNQLEC
jgi:hypothetical protein